MANEYKVFSNVPAGSYGLYKARCTSLAGVPSNWTPWSYALAGDTTAPTGILATDITQTTELGAFHFLLKAASITALDADVSKIRWYVRSKATTAALTFDDDWQPDSILDPNQLFIYPPQTDQSLYYDVWAVTQDIVGNYDTTPGTCLFNNLTATKVVGADVDLDADDVDESVTRKWAGESGADVTLTAINGELSVTGGGIVMSGVSPKIRAGSTGYNSGIGFWLGMDSSTPKFSIGDPVNQNMKWDGTTLSISGAMDLGGTSYVAGGATGYNTGTGFWMGYDSGYKFFIGTAAGNKMLWNGTTLAITGTVTATAGTVGGWTLAATTLSCTGITLDSGNDRIAIVGTDSYIYIGTDGAGSYINLYEADNDNIVVNIVDANVSGDHYGMFYVKHFDGATEKGMVELDSQYVAVDFTRANVSKTGRVTLAATGNMGFTCTSSAFDFTGAVDASGGFKDNGTAGVDGTFVDHNSNTITVSGGIITDLTT